MKKAITIIISAALLFYIAITMANLVEGANGTALSIITDIISVAVCTLVLCYNFFAFKEPHGNLLKYTCLIFGFALIIITFLLGRVDLNGLIYIVAGTLIVYMSGRLNKLEKNKVLIIIILILLALYLVFNACGLNVSFVETSSTAAEGPVSTATSIYLVFTMFAALLQWISLSFAYVTRFKEHKEAGLAEKTEA